MPIFMKVCFNLGQSRLFNTYLEEQKMEKITVFLGDWQVLFREGIHFTLSGEEDIEVRAGGGFC